MALPPLVRPIERGLAKTFAGHIHWRACGQGPAVMISHINQQSSALMIELLQALAPNFRAIAIDYPSHGHSDHVSAQPSIEDYARCVIEVMDSLKIERAFALGEAVGAGVSYALGANYKQRIDKVVAINTPWFEGGGRQDIADIAKVRPSDSSGFPAPRSLEFVLANDPDHAPIKPTQSWMDRINTAQLEVGRDRWQAVQAFSGFDRGHAGQAHLPRVDALWREVHLRQIQAAGAHRLPTRDARNRERRPLLHDMGACYRHRPPCTDFLLLTRSSRC